MHNTNTAYLLTSYIQKLQQCGIIAYSTEAVFALVCDPDNEIAVNKLLNLKQRSLDKGLIVIFSNYIQLKPYVEEKHISSIQRKHMFSCWPGQVTFPTPCQTPSWLTDKFKSLAIRVSKHLSVKLFCHLFGKPLVSSSANISGKSHCRTEKYCSHLEVLFQYLLQQGTLVDIKILRPYMMY